MHPLSNHNLWLVEMWGGFLLNLPPAKAKALLMQAHAHEVLCDQVTAFLMKMLQLKEE